MPPLLPFFLFIYPFFATSFDIVILLIVTFQGIFGPGTDRQTRRPKSASTLRADCPLDVFATSGRRLLWNVVLTVYQLRDIVEVIRSFKI